MCCNNNSRCDFPGGVPTSPVRHQHFNEVLATFQTVRHTDIRSFDTIHRIPNRFVSNNDNCCRSRCRCRDEFQIPRPPVGSINARGFGFDECDDDLDYIWL